MRAWVSRRLVAPVLLCCCVVLLLPGPVGFAQPRTQASGATVQLLESRIKEVEGSSELDEAAQEAALELYRQAIGYAEQARAHKTAASEFTRARETAPDGARALRAELEALESAAPASISEALQRVPLPELEQQVLGEKATLVALEARLGEVEQALELHPQRATQARTRLAEAKARDAAIAAALKGLSAEDTPAPLAEARRWALQNEALALSAEIQRLDQELLSQPMRSELQNARRDKLTLEVKLLSERVQLMEALLIDRRRAEARVARNQAEATERQASGKHPLVQKLAEENTQLGEVLNTLAGELEEVTAEENAVTEEAKRTAENFRLARQRLEIAGLSQALGQVLLEQSRGLKDAVEFRRAGRRIEDLIVEANLRQLRHQQERGQLRDINGYVEGLLEGLPFAGLAPPLRAELTSLAESRRELIDKAIAADDTFLQRLSEFDHAQRQLSETVAAYRTFLDARLLWIRSGDLPSLATLASISQTLAIFTSSEHWLSLRRALLQPASFPWVLMLGLAAFAVLIARQKTFRAALQRSGANVGALRHDRFSNTLKAVAWTLLLALPWPVLFLTLGLHLQMADGRGSLAVNYYLQDVFTSKGQFVQSLGVAFQWVAPLTFYFSALRAFCKPSGLAVVHFVWSLSSTELLRQEVRRLAFVFVPTAYLFTATIAYDPSSLGGGMSRLCFAIVMAALAWFFLRVLTPANGVLSGYYSANPRSPLTWFRYLWLSLGLAVPVALAGLAIAGYVYTAGVVAERVVDTLWLGIVLLFSHQLIVRWLLLIQRRLAFKAALKKHRAQRALQHHGDTSEVETSVPLAEEPDVDFQALGADTAKLINTVLIIVAAVVVWAVWADVLPAFRILDDVTLWHYSSKVDGVDTAVPVTANDGILALVILALGLVAARRLPALLEIALLARLKISAGSRYAVSTLTQYAIVGAGVIMLFKILGGEWLDVQWLIAALGVGIGFGLQEIVANFISGLILLFERPIRIGDVVTVGDTDGVVTKIRIRSTTIRNWDQKELVVPNKEFITGRLLNWTLSDPVTRIVIPVGIAYGSDVARALELIDEAAREHERVLQEPQPLVTFESFGDNALTIMLRCYIGSLDQRLQIASELNQAINRRFEQAGIVIAFPQRDIHLDTAQPLDVRIHRVQPSDADSPRSGGPSKLHPVGETRRKTSKPTGSDSGG